MDVAALETAIETAWDNRAQITPETRGETRGAFPLDSGLIADLRAHHQGGRVGQIDQIGIGQRRRGPCHLLSTRCGWRHRQRRTGEEKA